MKQEKLDFAFWCGCNWRFSRICGLDKDPTMIKCPFNNVDDEETNCSMFFYKAITNKLEKEVVEPSKSGNITFATECKMMC